MTASRSAPASRLIEDDPRLALVSRVTRHLEDNGVDGQSLRSIAAGAGTSHRMLLYHFGSRDGLLSAVVDGLWQRLHEEFLAHMTSVEAGGAREAALRLWSVLDRSVAFTPLFFELSASAMRGASWREAFRAGARAWHRQLADTLLSAGLTNRDADALARTTLQVVRGALWETAITGDQDSVDAAIRTFLSERWPGSDSR